MRMRSIGATCLALGLWLIPLSRTAMGQSFNAPVPATDSTQSLGQFSIVVNPAFKAAVQANFPSMYNAGTNIFTSPLLFDSATMIDRSMTTTVGSPAYNAGLPVGNPPNGIVTPAALAGYGYPAGYTPTAGEDTVFTQINTFNLAKAAALPSRPVRRPRAACQHWRSHLQCYRRQYR